MKEYGDEEFISILKEGRENREIDIRKGKIFIGGKSTTFKEREIIKKRMWMLMPEDFGPLSKELAKIKYPNENRPDIIYTNQQTTVNVTCSHKADKLKEGQEEEIRDYMEQVVKRMHPTSEVIDKMTIETGEIRLAWFDFVTPAVDTDIYNLMFFSSLRGRLLMGGFNCLDSDRDDQ